MRTNALAVRGHLGHINVSYQRGNSNTTHLFQINRLGRYHSNMTFVLLLTVAWSNLNG